MALLTLLNDPDLGVGLNEGDFLQSCALEALHSLRQMLPTQPPRTPRKDNTSAVSVTKDRFEVRLDVKDFAPEEITLRASEDAITVEAKQEERQDEHGSVWRHLVRKYKLPKGYDANLVTSELSREGLLTIRATRKQEMGEEREIPIAVTGQAFRDEARCEEETCEKK